MPARTCCECVAVVWAAWLASDLARAATSGSTSSVANVSGGGRPLDLDERLGQLVANGLERGDGATELHAVDRVLAGQREHRARRFHQLMGEGGAGGRHGTGPRAGDLDRGHRVAVEVEADATERRGGIEGIDIRCPEPSLRSRSRT